MEENKITVEQFKEILRTPEYWTMRIQSDIGRIVRAHLRKHNLTQRRFSKISKVRLRIVRAAVNDRFDSKLSHFVALLLACNVTPNIFWVNLDEYIESIVGGVPEHVVLQRHAERKQKEYEKRHEDSLVEPLQKQQEAVG